MKVIEDNRSDLETTSESDNRDRTVTSKGNPGKLSDRGHSAESNSSKDEGVHSTGEKEDDDIKEDELNNQARDSNPKNEDDDEGRGSLSGDNEQVPSIINNFNKQNLNYSHGYDADTETSLLSPHFNDYGEVYIEEEGDADNEYSDKSHNAADKGTHDLQQESQVFINAPTPGESPRERERQVHEVWHDGEIREGVQETTNAIEDSMDSGFISTKDKSLIIDENNIGRDIKKSLPSVDGARELVPELPAISKVPGVRRKKEKHLPTKNRSPSKVSIAKKSTLKESIKSFKPSWKNFTNRKAQRGKASNNSRITQALSPKKLPNMKLQNEQIHHSNDKSEPAFLNPLMDHSLARPIAPHKKKGWHDHTHNVKEEAGGSHKDKRSKSEVWIPEEDKLYVYTYSSAPRLLHVRRMGSKTVTTADTYATDPNSSFKLRKRNTRIIRGSNYTKTDLESKPWNPYFAYARSLSGNERGQFYESDETSLRRKEFRRKLEERARLRRENLGVSSLYPSRGTVIVHSPAVRKASPRFSHSKKLNKTIGPNARVSTSDSNQSNSNSKLSRRIRPLATVSTQVFEDELPPLENAEDAAVYALINNILRESALEVAIEAEADRSRMVKAAEKRFQAFGEKDIQHSKKEIVGNSFLLETDKRKDPDGEETISMEGRPTVVTEVA